MGSSQATLAKLVFVGGSSYSGSTLLDMVLANGESGFSCGEVGALFWPYRRRHLDAKSASSHPEGAIWADIRRRGERNLYRSIVEERPGIDVIVDSTKEPIWIETQAARAREQGFDVRHVLIWKTPDEFRASREKRGRGNGWLRAWMNYHRLYFSLIPEWVAIRYRSFAEDESARTALCHSLGIPYFQGKERYWEKAQFTLFGNTSAKIHLYDSNTDQYRHSYAELAANVRPVESEQTGVANHRTVRYSGAGSQVEPPLTQNEAKEVAGVLKVLAAGDVAIGDPGSGHRAFACSTAIHRMAPLEVGTRRAWRRVRTIGFRIRHPATYTW